MTAKASIKKLTDMLDELITSVDDGGSANDDVDLASTDIGTLNTILDELMASFDNEGPGSGDVDLAAVGIEAPNEAAPDDESVVEDSAQPRPVKAELTEDDTSDSSQPESVSVEATNLKKWVKQQRSIDDEFSAWEAQVDTEAVTKKKLTQLEPVKEPAEKEKPTPKKVVTPTGQLSLPEFPDIMIVAYDQQPTVRVDMLEMFEGFDMAVAECNSYDSFLLGLEKYSLPEFFTIAILGSEDDDEVNATRVAEIRNEFPEVPLIFLSPHDLSHIRRRILHNGASYFVKESDMNSSNMVSRDKITKRFHDDLITCVNECHARCKAVYTALVGSS